MEVYPFSAKGCLDDFMARTCAYFGREKLVAIVFRVP